jgi:vacuolar protein sorting-associated protein 26
VIVDCSVTFDHPAITKTPKTPRSPRGLQKSWFGSYHYDLYALHQKLHVTIDLDKMILEISGDCLNGSITIHKTPVKLKSMELILLRIESGGAKRSTETLSKFEIMDGSPSDGEIIPIRFMISGALSKKLTRSMYRVRGVLNVAYYIDFIFIDEMNRRFFKQQEMQMIKTRDL